MSMIRIERPTAPEIPVVYDNPHSGTGYPADFRPAMALARLRHAEDTHVAALFAHVTETGAPLLHALFPRSYLDVNRAPEDVDVSLIGGAWPHPVAASPKLARGAGLVWRSVPGQGEIYDRALSVGEVERRIETCWRPYHAALRDLLDRAHARFGAVWHVDCHSMPSTGDAAEEGAGLRPDFVVGDRDGTTCEPAFTELVAGVLRDAGATVAVNDPYKGVELVRRYADPAAGRHALQLEVSRALYMDERTLRPSPGFARTEALLRRLTGAVAAHARGRCALAG